MAEIPDAYLVLFFTGIFIPLFIFLMKMIIEQGKNSARLDKYDEHLQETKGITTMVALVKQRLEDLERDVKELFRKFNDGGRERRDRDRKYGSFYPNGDIGGGEGHE